MDTITSAGPKVLEDTIKEFTEVINLLNWKIDRPQWKSFHLSLKQGPNAQAMLGSIIDLNNLPPSLEDDICTLGGPQLKEEMDKLKSISLQSWLDKFNLTNRLALRRLSVVHAPEGKERVIAIFDYWSQAALKPLHDQTMAFLKTIRSDMTFNQLSTSGKLPNNGPYYSLDLHAATDRFPASVQHAVLGHFVQDQEYSDAWLRTMVDHEFQNPWTHNVKYAVGQPMGGYSS